MKSPSSQTIIPDLVSIRSEVQMSEIWDSTAIAKLIRSKSNGGATPAFLFLGQREASLLRRHLAEAFGSESVSTLKATYYQGLEVVAIEANSFVFAGGRKIHRTLQDPIIRRQPWQDQETAGLWQLRL